MMSLKEVTFESRVSQTNYKFHMHIKKKNVCFSYLLSGRNVKNETTGESYQEVSWSFILLKFSIGFKL